MSDKVTPLDAVIAEKLPAYIEAEARDREARRESNATSAKLQTLGVEMQNLLVARSILRDGKAYGLGDANVERAKLISEARR